MKKLVILVASMWLVMGFASIIYAAGLYGDIGSNPVSIVMIIMGCVCGLMGGMFLGYRKEV